MNSAITLILLVVSLLLVIYLGVVIFHLYKVGNLWRQAFMSQAPVRYFELIGMSFRKVPMDVVVKARIKAKHAGLEIDGPDGCTIERLERHFLAGGDVDRVVKAMIVAKSKGLELDFASAAQTDLAEQA